MRWLLAALLLAAGCYPRLGDIWVDETPENCSMFIDAGPECDVPADFGFVGSVATAKVSRRPDGTEIATVPLCTDQISLQLYPGRGPFVDGVKVGDFSIAGEDLSLETCGLCVRVFADVDAYGEPTRTYMATGGDVHLQALGAPGGAKFTASLENVTFREVTIDPLTFVTTPIGSCITRITSVDVQATVSPLR